MITLFGTKGKVTESSQADILPCACPNCNSDLELKDLKKWATLFFMPLFPIKKMDTFYQCNKCDSAYKKSAKQILLSASKTKAKAA